VIDARADDEVSLRRHGISLLNLCTARPPKSVNHANLQADEKALLDTAQWGVVEEVLRLLDQGVNVNHKNDVSAPSYYVLSF